MDFREGLLKRKDLSRPLGMGTARPVIHRGTHPRDDAAHIARGVVRIVRLDLAELRVPEEHFDTIFALNVNLFSTGEPEPVELVRRALRRGGRLVLGYARRDGHQLTARAERISANLRAGGLTGPTLDWADPQRLYLTAIRD